MSRIEVVGLISAVIAILGATGKVYNNLRDTPNLPRAFRDVAERLPLIQDALKFTERHIGPDTDNEACQAMKTIVERCKVKAEHLEKIINAAVPSEHSSWLERHRLAAQCIRKGDRVDVLTKEMMEDVRLLAMNRAINAATEAQITELLKATKEPSSTTHPLPNDDSVAQYHSGSGDNVIGDKVMGNLNVVNGSGTAYFGAVTQYYGLDSDISATIAKAEDCLRDMFLTDPYEDMQALKRKKGGRAKGTCDWILKTEELTAWLRDEAQSTVRPTEIFWIHGNPGTGKSTMSMFLSEALSEGFSKTPTKTLAYFFCDSGYDTRKTATAIVRGLLLQLVRQHRQLIEHVLPAYKLHGIQLFDLFDALWIVFLNACADESTGHKFCIVDALDECSPDEQETLLKQIEHTFGQARTSTSVLNVKLLITSRPYPEIREYLQDFPKIDLALCAGSRQDVDTFIVKMVAKLSRRKSYPSSVSTSITRILRERAGGIFLWVGQACQELEKVPSRHAVAHLQDIPKGLQLLYRHLLDTALQQCDNPDTLKLLFNLIVAARRPLTIREVASACHLYQGEDEEELVQFTKETIAACRLMVVVRDENVLLLHQSVKDFLVISGGGFISELKAHGRLASQCVDCLLSHFSSKGGGDAAPYNDFVPYSIQFWPDHAHMAGVEFEIEAGQSEFFANDSITRGTWWRVFCQQVSVWESSWESVFHVATRWGIPTSIEGTPSSKYGKSTETASFAPDDSAGWGTQGEPTPVVHFSTLGNALVVTIDFKPVDAEIPVSAAAIRTTAFKRSQSRAFNALMNQTKGHMEILEDYAESEPAAGNVERKVRMVTITIPSCPSGQ